LNSQVRYLLHDSRQLTSPGETAFFAIRGPHHDGHRYLPDLYQRGVREFVVETDVDKARYPGATIWRVENSIRALQELAAAHRAKFSVPVVGITGSNGKTIVKEWLGQLLAPDFVVCKSPKSYNSQIGVPLSVWQLNDTHTLGIFEAGVSVPGEMANLERVIQPTIGIFTNIGSAHDEGFENRSQKIREKLELFRHVRTFVYCADYTDITAELPGYLRPDCQVLAWAPGAVWAGLTKPPETDDATAENLGHCVTLLRYLGIPDAEIARRLGTLRPVSMRLELKEALNGCTLVDDSYNNDLVGLGMALNFLANQHQRPHRVAILSDVLQSGVPEPELYARIAQLLKDKGVNQLIAIGEAFSRNQMAFALPAKFYASTDEFLARFRPSDFQQSVVLVKGARSFQFEKITARLAVRTHGTVLEINLDAISHNLNVYREKLGSGTRIMVMVKAFAYGSGSAEVANLLQFHRVDYLAVAYADEGVTLRQAGVRTPIMVMNPSAATFSQLIDFNLEPEIYSTKILREWLDFITQSSILHSPFSIHLKLDTGMHRLGFEESELDAVLETLRQTPRLRVASVFSHLAAADDRAFDDFTTEQVSRFTRMADRLEAALGYAPLRHLLNSAGIARFPDARMSMARLGIGLYGVAVRPEDQARLRTVGTLRTVISQLKTVPPSETVGYGRRGELSRETRVATIALGYADGYDRGFSRGVGRVLVNGTLCPVLGNVCMDMTMVDVTDAEAAEGDEVIIFGENPTIRDLADWIGTIPYEILTGVSERVRRVFFREGN
jgi:alanine racemase